MQFNAKLGLGLFKSADGIWAVVLTLASLANAGLSLLVSIIIARMLSPQGFGDFSASLSTIYVVLPLAGFGVAQSWLKSFRERYDGASPVLGSYYLLTGTVVSAILAIIVWSYVGEKSDEMRSALHILSFLIFSQTLIELVSVRMQILDQFNFLSGAIVLQTVLRLISLIIVLLLFRYDMTVERLAFAFIVPSGLVALIALLVLRRGIHVAHDLSLAQRSVALGPKAIMSRSWPFALAASSQVIYYQSDIVMLAQITSTEEAAFYSVASVIIGSTYLFPAALFHRYLQPKVYDWAVSSPESLKALSLKGSSLMAALGILASLATFLVSDPLIRLLFGDVYSPAVSIIYILVFAIPFVYVSYCLGSILLSGKFLKIKALMMFVVACINVASNSFIIPLYGAEGAAITTVASAALLCGLYFGMVRRQLYKVASPLILL
ncbi:MAG: oligosaccharide flippase family protein [Porticoccaceae bacterium]|nr:oligosaccharide flippase family protein [Porticoccaceae bacterium]